MNQLNKVNSFLKKHANEAGIAFQDEIATDENKDYRRGFRAGVFFSFLQMKSDIGNIEDVAAERSTD